MHFNHPVCKATPNKFIVLRIRSVQNFKKITHSILSQFLEMLTVIPRYKNKNKNLLVPPKTIQK